MLASDQSTDQSTDKSIDSAMKYQGRKTSRAGSELRRKAILEAALRVGIREGVRGIRHRAVAKEADVPLSATTYYFKDINDLITDTFTLFVEHAIDDLSKFWVDSSNQFETHYNLLDGSEDTRRIFAANMTDIAVEYINNQLLMHRDRVLAEQALQQEALRSDRLRDIVITYRQGLASDLERFYERMGSVEPELDASLTSSVILDIEYQCLLFGEDQWDKVPVRALLHRHIQLTLGVGE